MLAKRNRLTHHEFSRCFASGRRSHSDYFTIIHCPNAEFAAAVVVGKKVYKRAHERNRLRRQLYPVLRAWHQFTTQTGTLIILVKPSLTKLPQAAVEIELRAALEKMVKDCKKR